MDETEHLLSNPENERRLREAIEELERGKGVLRELSPSLHGR
jgi:PHD/YefM family antitoxin component YafN of YafNO toxin-antitoxin module